jgi:hypothetical protein
MPASARTFGAAGCGPRLLACFVVALAAATGSTADAAHLLLAAKSHELPLACWRTNGSRMSKKGSVLSIDTKWVWCIF